MVKEKSDILLVQTPPWGVETAPLGLAYLAAFLKSRNIKTDVFDLNIWMYNSFFDKEQKGWARNNHLWGHNEGSSEEFECIADKILEYDTPMIGFSVTIDSCGFLTRLLEAVEKKASDKIIVVGGAATFSKNIRTKKLKNSFIDYFVVGDGEFALFELLNIIRNKQYIYENREKFDGLWKDDPLDKTVCLKKAVLDLDCLPYPTFEEFNMADYEKGEICLPIIYSKGCSRKCTFCSDTALSSPLRYRDPEKVVEQIKMYLKLYPKIEYFTINDLSFNCSLGFIDRFCDLIISEGLKISWYGQAQINPDMDLALLVKMKKAGCDFMSLGLETFSDNVLRMMKKQYLAGEALEFLKRAKKAGLENHVNLIVGYPGETENDFNANLEYLKKSKPYIDRISSLNICGFPEGSELNSYPEEHGCIDFEHGYWKTLDESNTWQTRVQRFKRAVSYIRELNIPVNDMLDVESYHP